MRRLTLPDVILSIVVIALAAFTLVPAIARIQRTGPLEAKCQANLQRLAEAMELYRADHQGAFPTNRYVSGGVPGAIVPSLNLSPPNPPPGQTEPPRFVYGLNWVEALYPYLQASAEKTGQDRKSFWKCPSAPSKRFPASTTSNCAVNYVFNRNLVEKPSVFLRNARKVMMLREFSRLTISMLRPMGSADSTGNSAVRPFYPFLNKFDGALWPSDTSKEYNLHGNGSYILFADGHVRHFTVDYYPEFFNITAVKSYDPNTQQWYNYYYAYPVTPDERAKNKSIAITP